MAFGIASTRAASTASYRTSSEVAGPRNGPASTGAGAGSGTVVDSHTRPLYPLPRTFWHTVEVDQAAAGDASEAAIAKAANVVVMIFTVVSLPVRRAVRR